MTKNEVIIKWRVPLTDKDAREIASKSFREGLPLLMVVVVMIAIALPITYRVFSVVYGPRPRLIPMLLVFSFFALPPALQLLTAIQIWAGKQPRGRTHRITERGFDFHDDGGFSWKYAICFDIQPNVDDSLTSVWIYRKSGCITRARLPFEPERSEVLKALEKFVPQRNSSHQIRIRKEDEDIPVWKRWSFVILAIAGGATVGLNAKGLKEIFGGLDHKELRVFLAFTLPVVPVILWTIALSPKTPRCQRRATLGWLIASAVIAILAFGITMIAPEVLSILQTPVNQAPTTQSLN